MGGVEVETVVETAVAVDPLAIVATEVVLAAVDAAAVVVAELVLSADEVFDEVRGVEVVLGVAEACDEDSNALPETTDAFMDATRPPHAVSVTAIAAAINIGTNLLCNR